MLCDYCGREIVGLGVNATHGSYCGHDCCNNAVMHPRRRVDSRVVPELPPAGSGGTATVTFVGGERSGGKTYRIHRLGAAATPDSPVYMRPTAPPPAPPASPPPPAVCPPAP